MFYFIPAWYKGDSWEENEQNWYVRRTCSEFDDIIKQIQLFHRKAEWDYNVILLSYAPNLRHFFHRQGLFRANYWSCFDAMCCIRRRKASLFSYLDINWPEGIEFEYTPFVIIANKDDIKYAEIEFGEDGNLIRIVMFEDEKIVRSNSYDDRGFVSSSVIYENGVEKYVDYFNELGERKLRVYSSDGHVEINANKPFFMLKERDSNREVGYKKMVYNSLDEVIEEVFSKYIESTDSKDVFCAAMHDRHVDVLVNTLKNKKLILSFFENRRWYSDEKLNNIVNKADYVVTDSENMIEKIKSICGELTNIIDISPYDSRTDFGVSQQLAVQKILVPIDNLDDEIFNETIISLLRYIETNEKAQINLITRDAKYNKKQVVFENVKRIVMDAGISSSMFLESENEQIFGQEENSVNNRMVVNQCIDEHSVSKCVKEQRILVDMSATPDLYIQISAISSCIPQIVVKKTQYIENGENGRIISEPSEMIGWLHFYLDGLSNWNEAKICSYEMGKWFSTDVLLEKWRKVVEAVG